ncbi:MAG: CGGC domain-containing protein [Halobacteriota archaeon]
MKRIVIVACKKAREQHFCPGDAKCLVAMMRRVGEFERYKDEDASIIAIVECGECPGTRVAGSLGLLKTQLVALNETPDVIHVASCVMALCAYKDDLINLIKEKAGIEVVEGTHKYAKPKIFEPKHVEVKVD